jgi:IS4 transposase
VVNSFDQKKIRYVVLFSTDLELSARLIVEYYKARFSIEFIFRDAKQFAGFSDCQSREKQVLHFHFNASV